MARIAPLVLLASIAGCTVGSDPMPRDAGVDAVVLIQDGATSDAGPQTRCLGTPTACATRRGDACRHGCARVACMGTATFCSFHGNMDDCVAVGCNWEGRCTGGAPDCGTHEDRATCGLAGCTFADDVACGLTPLGCEELGAAECESIPGCYPEGSEPPVCEPGEIACGRVCTRVAADSDNCGSCGNVCPAGVGCAAGRCSCMEPMIACDGICLDPSADTMNCGSCGNVCADGEMCSAGVCLVRCEAPDMICVNRDPDGTSRQVCADLTSDPVNCGRCNTRCAGGAVCTDSRCACPSGQLNCAGLCVDTATDPENCGSCRVSCGPGGTCTAGRCSACGGGTMDCSGRCIDVSSDRFNCGSCGRSCGMGEACSGGLCTCAMGLIDCGSGCLDPRTDVRNCGGCGNDCGPGGVCMAATCTCSGSLTLCGGGCRDLMADPRNCGTCGTVCSVTGSVCVGGACMCPAGMTDCSGTCRNLASDRDHCGACGMACPAGQVCVARSCTDVPPPPNDACSGAIALSGASGTRTMDTLVGASQDSSGDCGGAEVYYSFTITARSLLYLDTFGTGFDTRVAYRGTTCTGTAASCVDDSCTTTQSQLAVVAEPGTHFFSVHVAPTATAGPLSIRWQVLAAAGGINMQITASGTFSGTTSSAMSFRGATCGGSAASAEDGYWFTLCPSVSRSVSANTCMGTSYDSVLHAHGPTGQLACNDDSCGVTFLQSMISFPANGPGVFEIFVDGFSSGSTGPYQVVIGGL